MPLFFLLSGMSSYYALGRRTQTEFIKERSKRLMIPYIFGICTILSIQVYYETLFGNDYLPSFEGNFLEFYFLHYFTHGFYYMGGFFPLTGIYLWYLLFLFIFTLVCLKLFLLLRKEHMIEKLSNLANFSTKKGGILIFTIPMIILEIVGIVFLPFIQPAGWSVLVYLCIFIYGYIFASNDQFKKALEKNRFLTLIIGTVSSIIGITAYLNLSSNIILMILFVIFLPLSGLCWLVTILGFASKHLNKRGKHLEFLNELVLPFYIFHQAIIIMVDYYIIQLDILIFLKYLLVLITAFGITLGLVLVIGRINLLRFLLGMRIKKIENPNQNISI